jgi:WD40 repeat protein
MAPPAQRLWQLWRQGQQPDVRTFLADAGQLPPAEVAAALLVDQRERWRLGERIRIEDYLRLYPHLCADDEYVLELIYGEFLLCEERREAPDLESYLQRFPEHAERLKQQVELHEAVKSVEQASGITELGSSVNGPEGEEAAVLAPGTSLGRFRIRRELGCGGFGLVLLAFDPALDREVALKVPRSFSLATHEQRERFHTEARAAAGLDHPNLVQVYEAGSVGRVCYIASAYCPGPTLAAWLQERDTLLPGRLVAHLLATVAGAVEHAHSRGIVHRDLKPANILLQTGERGARADQRGRPGPLSASRLKALDPALVVPKITDFGLAKILDTAGLAAAEWHTQSGTILGTPSYMAPEQAMGRTKQIGPATDVYALGAILYEMLTGRPPFEAETAMDTLFEVVTTEPVAPSRLQPKVSRDLETICLKCLAKDPASRYPTAAALEEELRRFQDGKPIMARPAGALERGWRWSRRNPLVAGAAALFLLALTSLAGLATAFAIYKDAAAERLQTEKDQTQEALRAKERFATQLALEQTETIRALTESRRSAANLALDRAQALGEQGEIDTALLWLGRALATCPPEDRPLQRVIRANWSAWRPRLPSVRMLFGHDSAVRSADFSPDGVILATGGADGSTRLWKVENGEQQLQLRGEKSPVIRLAFSPDGGTLATGSASGHVRLWNTATGKPIGPVRKHDREITALAFTSDGKRLLSGSYDDTAQLWDSQTGEPQGARMAPGKGRVESAALSHDGRIVVLGCSGNSLCLFEAATGKPLGELSFPGRAFGVAFSPDGKKVYGISGDIRTYDVATRKELPGPPLANPTVAEVATLSRDGKVLLTGGREGPCRLWDMTKREAIGSILVHQAWVGAVALSPDGRFALTGSQDNTARLWDAVAGQAIGGPLHHEGEVTAVAFSPAGGTFLTASEDGSAYLRDLPASPSRAVLTHAEEVWRVAFSPDGRTFATTGGPKHATRLWEVATGKPIGPPLQHQGTVNALAYRNDSQRLLTGGEDGLIVQWDTATGQPIGPRIAHSLAARRVAFSPDGRNILTAHTDMTVRLWDADSGHQRTGFEHPKAVCIAFSPDGRLVATGGYDAHARLWDASTGRLVHALPHPDDAVAVAFSPDGRTLVVGGLDRTARLWDVSTGKPIGQPLRHNGWIGTLAFTTDGRRLLTAGWDRTARLWYTDTQQPSAPPLVHQGPVFDATFSLDGHTVATASMDRTARLWDTSTGKPIGPLLRHDGPVDCVALSPDGRVLLTGSTDKSARLWSVPQPTEAPAERVVLWTEVLTGRELDANGAVHFLGSAAWKQRQQRLHEHAGSPLP